MVKKFLCLVLILLLAVPMVQSSAEDARHESGPTRYSYINTVSSGLRITGSTATCFGMGRGKNADTTTRILVTLQRKAAGAASWASVKSWSASGSGTSTVTVEQTCTVASGYSYRVRVRCQIRDASGTVLETAYRNSTIVSY